jgi:hypothetical protein
MLHAGIYVADRVLTFSGFPTAQKNLFYERLYSSTGTLLADLLVADQNIFGISGEIAELS